MAESFVVGVVVAPDDVAADHAGLLFVAGMIGAVEREVGRAVNWPSIRFNRGGAGADPAVPGGGPGRAEVVGDDRDADRRRGEGAQVAAEAPGPDPALARPGWPAPLFPTQYV